MKRIWFAVIFLIIAASLCFTEQNYVKDVYIQLTQKIETAQECAQNEDAKQLEKSINEIKEYWNKNNQMLCAVADHGILDDLGTEINALSMDDVQETKSALDVSKALTKILYENQKVTFANVF